MATTTLTRLYDSHVQALEAVSDLEAAGVQHDRISLISNNADNWHEGHKHPERKPDEGSDIAGGAGKGAATGGVLGAGAGALAGLGMLAIPGLGPVVAAGWLASTAAGAAVGLAAGGATGGILGALKDAGHSDEDAHVYAEAVRRGGTLVSVKVEADEAARLQDILDGRRGYDARVRGDAYREAGWSRFDPDGPAWSSDQIAEERARYR